MKNEFEKWARLYLPELNDIQMKLLLDKVDALIEDEIEDAMWHERIGQE